MPNPSVSRLPFVPRDVAFEGPFMFPSPQQQRDDEWKCTPAGTAIAAALETRGLTDEHILVLENGDDTLTISWPPSILGLNLMTIASDGHDLEPAALSAGLDVCLAALARESMMLRAGWRQDEPPPAWSLEVTDITDRVLRSVGANPYELWDRAAWDCEFAFELPQVSAKAIVMRRHGHRLLTSQIEVAPGIVIEERPATTVRFADPAPLAPLMRLSPGDRLPRPFVANDQPTRASDLEIATVLHDVAGGSVRAGLHAPVLTMAPIPDDACVNLEPRLLSFEVEGPIWWSVRRISREDQHQFVGVPAPEPGSFAAQVMSALIADVERTEAGVDLPAPSWRLASSTLHHDA